MVNGGAPARQINKVAKSKTMPSKGASESGKSKVRDARSNASSVVNSQVSRKQTGPADGVKAWLKSLVNVAPPFLSSSASEVGSTVTSLGPSDSISQIGQAIPPSLPLPQTPAAPEVLVPRGRVETPKRLDNIRDYTIERSSPIGARLTSDRRKTHREHSQLRCEDETVERPFSRAPSSSRNTRPSGTSAVNSTASSTRVDDDGQVDYWKTKNVRIAAARIV